MSIEEPTAHLFGAEAPVDEEGVPEHEDPPDAEGVRIDELDCYAALEIENGALGRKGRTRRPLRGQPPSTFWYFSLSTLRCSSALKKPSSPLVFSIRFIVSVALSFSPAVGRFPSLDKLYSWIT